MMVTDNSTETEWLFKDEVVRRCAARLGHRYSANMFKQDRLKMNLRSRQKGLQYQWPASVVDEIVQRRLTPTSTIGWKDRDERYAGLLWVTAQSLPPEETAGRVRAFVSDIVRARVLENAVSIVQESINLSGNDYDVAFLEDVLEALESSEEGRHHEPALPPPNYDTLQNERINLDTRIDKAKREHSGSSEDEKRIEALEKCIPEHDSVNWTPLPFAIDPRSFMTWLERSDESLTFDLERARQLYRRLFRVITFVLKTNLAEALLHTSSDNEDRTDNEVTLALLKMIKNKDLEQMLIDWAPLIVLAIARHDGVRAAVRDFIKTFCQLVIDMIRVAQTKAAA